MAVFGFGIMGPYGARHTSDTLNVLAWQVV